MSEPAARQRHVICMKWGTKYGPEYVNRLYAMVRRHLRGDFHMVCLTDNRQGIRPEVSCYPIPPLDLPPGSPERGWTKLVSFSKDLHGLRGTALFLDVDVVITGALDPFFEQPGEFLIIHDYKRPWRITGNSSVYRFELGAHPDVLEYFRTHVDEVRAKFRNEQAYLSDFLHRQGKLQYWPRSVCSATTAPRVNRSTSNWPTPWTPRPSSTSANCWCCGAPSPKKKKRSMKTANAARASSKSSRTAAGAASVPK